VKRFARRFTETYCAAALAVGVSEFQERFIFHLVMAQTLLEETILIVGMRQHRSVATGDFWQPIVTTTNKQRNIWKSGKPQKPKPAKH
jgi:hypothetical protein